MKVLLTGGSGFIGKQVVRFFLEQGDELVVPTRKFVDISSPRLKQVQISKIEDILFMPVLYNSVDVIVHCAGVAHAKYCNELVSSINVDFVQKFATVSAQFGVARFIFLSSINVYKKYTTCVRINEFSKDGPSDKFALAKKEAEARLKEIETKTPIEVVIIRTALVYGKNAPGNIGKLEKIILKCPVLPFGLVDNRRSYVSILNLVSIIYLSAHKKDAAGKTFIAVDKESMSTKELANKIASFHGIKVFHIPVPVNFLKFLFGAVAKKTIDLIIGDFQVDAAYTDTTLELSKFQHKLDEINSND